jgi:hypothetical protein
MQNKFIIDKEINLNDSDFLKTKIYADNLTKIIKNAESNRVFTIGLFGNWGTGKSSIIKTSQQDFAEKNTRFVTYDAWQYVNDSFRRMFLLKLREELKFEETDLMKKFYENESTDIGETYKFNWKNIPISIVVLTVFFVGCLISILLIGDNSWKAGLTISAIISFASLVYTIIQGFILKLKVSVVKPHFFAPEQFEECFKEIVSNSLSKPNKVLKWIKHNNSIQHLEKLVIVIDNIDRCSNEVAYNLLTDIKTFFASEPFSVVFVIPVDDEALKKHIINNNKTDFDCDKEKEEFLRKFFNVTLRIKPYGETDMYSFAKLICEKSGLAFKSETINVASKEYAKNPRRIIQLFNNLLAEMNYYDADFIQRNETLICCVLIIREEYSKYYNMILNSPKIFNEEYQDKNEEKLERFIRIAQTALGRVEISDLSKVLTNSHHQFDDIAVDLKDAIETFNSEKILNIWNVEKEHISKYIFDRIDNAIKNLLIETDLVAYFDLMAYVNSEIPLEPPFAKRIDERIQPYIPILITKTKHHENLCKYALLRDSQKDNKIKTAIIDDCKRSENQDKGLYWKPLFNAVLKTFKDKKTSIDLSTTFLIYQNETDYSDYSEEQLNHLLSSKFVQDRIAELPIDDNGEILLNLETEQYQKIVWIFRNKKNIDVGTYAHLFAKIIGENNDYSRMRGKAVDEIVGIVNFINPLLDLIPDRMMTNQPQTLYGLIVNDRNIPHPSNPNNPSYDLQANFIDECIENEKYIPELTNFVINIYRITNNNTDVKRELGKLLSYTYLEDEFIQLIKKGYSLQPILNLIFDDKDDFSLSDRLIVLKHCFDQKDKKGIFLITDEKSKTKINEILDFAHSKNSVEAFEFLENLIEQERYKNQLTALIVEKDSLFVNSLPNSLLKLGVNSFTKDSHNKFADNFEFLSVIIQKGNNSQKSYVVKILTAKLDANQDVERVFDLIESMENVPSFDKSGLLHSHLDNYQNQNKEVLSKELDDRINNLKKKVK